jgi:hypothetical protein
VDDAHRRHATVDNPSIVSARDDLRRLISGYQVSQALHVAATLRIADRLEAGPRDAADLAAETQSDPDALYRLLRALARIGVFLEDEDGRFGLTPLGDGLRTNAPGSLHAQAAHAGRPYHWSAWSGLRETVRTGEPAFPRAHGRSVWEYRVDHPEDGRLFDDWMTAQTRLVDVAIVDGFDFGSFAHVIDVGGGHGAFLAAILAASLEIRGTLFDQEHVVAHAPPIDRCEVRAGSFFEAVPRGGDAYVLKSVIHDWSDEDAVRILRTCREALEGDARVLVIERDLEGDAVAPWMDLQMLVMLGGRERTAGEYAALFRAAGLQPEEAVPVGAGFTIFPARL